MTSLVNERPMFKVRRTYITILIKMIMIDDDEDNDDGDEAEA